MTSVTAICNMALANIGKERINSITESSTEARACNQFYDNVLDTLLEAYPWRFAGKTQSLGEVTNDMAGRWEYAYERPTDCKKVRWVRPQYSTDDLRVITLQEELATPYEIDGNVIYCNLSPAFLRYTFRQTDPTRFSALFIDALSWYLSARIAMPLTREIGIRNEAFQMARSIQASAEMHDANEVRETSDHDSELVEVRV